MLIRNSDLNLDVITLNGFLGSKIHKAGCPLLYISDTGEFAFMKGRLFDDALSNLPLYYRFLIKATLKSENN